MFIFFIHLWENVCVHKFNSIKNLMPIEKYFYFFIWLKINKCSREIFKGVDGLYRWINILNDNFQKTFRTLLKMEWPFVRKCMSS